MPIVCDLIDGKVPSFWYTFTGSSFLVGDPCVPLSDISSPRYETSSVCLATAVQFTRESLISDIAIFVLKRDVKLQLTN